MRRLYIASLPCAATGKVAVFATDKRRRLGRVGAKLGCLSRLATWRAAVKLQRSDRRCVEPQGTPHPAVDLRQPRISCKRGKSTAGVRVSLLSACRRALRLLCRPRYMTQTVHASNA
ncbi:hypothetical protein BV20DRAFT_209891 [Pilatotrama ljubarskyi]|nr:hypothetical protein BV20DRAFT_209891 [Pilatotrama ljubarskyi]